MKVPLISVIIPTYNFGRFVTMALESALAQTYPAKEIIVVDDGSTDDTASRLAPYEGRVRIIVQPNRGLSAARNTGIRAGRGDWMALLDADDVWHRDKLTMQMAAVQQLGEVGLVGSPAADPLPDRLPDPEILWLGVRDFLLSSPFGPSSALIRRSHLESVGLFDESLCGAEDRDLWLRLASRFPAAVIRSPCWTYRRHGGQLSLNAGNTYHFYRKSLGNFFRSHPEHVGLRGLAFGHLHMDAGVCYLDSGNLRSARSHLVRSILHWPLPFRDPRQKGRLKRLKFLIRATIGEAAFGHLARTAKARPGPTGRGPSIGELTDPAHVPLDALDVPQETGNHGR